MERVTGIGGVFFKAGNPEALTRWYAEHLGVDAPPETYDIAPWRQEAGDTVFAAMPGDSDRFGSHEQSWAINFRVNDLDAMVEQLRTADITVTVDPQTYPNGRFADLADPEGHPIRLWQVA